MHASTFFASLLSASAALALPQPKAGSGSAVDKIELPESTLPVPTPGQELKYVVLGVGTQNYSCKATPNNGSATPASNGAKATLYDISYVLSQGTPAIRQNTAKVLPSLALSAYELYGAGPDKLPAAAQLQLRPAGHHFFSAGSRPVFVIDNGGAKKGGLAPARIEAKKLDGVPAPAGAFPGAQGEGAVDWLLLGDSGNGVSAGTPLEGGLVYRVETAGGVAPASCAGRDGDVLVRYSAEYFLYGPASSS